MIHLILKQFLQASYFTMYITKICFLHSSFMCIWVMQVKNSFVLYSWRGKVSTNILLLSLQIQHFLQFVKTIYKDLPTNVVWWSTHSSTPCLQHSVVGNLFSVFSNPTNKQQNEAVFLLFFRNNSLTLCQYQPLGFYQQRTMLVPPLLPSLTLG